MVTLEQFDEFRQRFGSGQAGGVSDATFLGELRAKVASADVLVEALREITYSHDGYARKKAEQALATYDKLSKVSDDL